MKFLIKNKLNVDNRNQLSRVCFKKQLLGLIALMLFAQLVVAGSHPNMYLNQAEIDGIKAKVAEGTEPWFSSYKQVMSTANALLNAPVDPEKPYLSVTYQGRTTKIYHTPSPYCGWTRVDGLEPDCRTGQINPAQSRGDYIAAIALGDAVRDLGLAYAFTGDAAYAEKAINYIRVWSINSVTRMDPRFNVSIELYITMPGYFYGADLIWNYSGWDTTEKNAFRSWVGTIAETTMIEQGKIIALAVDSQGNPTSSGLNNFANWRNVLLAAAGALLDDNELLDYAEWAWKHLIWVQMNGVGSEFPGFLRQETTRNRGLHYSLYAVNAMLQTAEIMHHRGVNLYDYEGPGETSLRLVLGFVTPFAKESCIQGDTSDCTWRTEFGRKQITDITQNDSMAMYELAYSYYQDPDYLEVINHWGRPMDEIRIMGINTLTHANLFELDFEPIPPSITTQPESISVAEGGDVSFNVQAIGDHPLNYQWFLDGAKIPGAIGSSYTVEQVSAIDDGGVYYCKVSNSLGEVLSNNATLTVMMDTTVSITAQPESISVTEGEDANFSVVAAGSGPLTYQWFHNGVSILGATSANYTVTNTTSSDNGSTYSCDVSNSLGSVSCSDALLTVLDEVIPPVPEMLSDEFNGASLNSAQWTFVDPVGDSTISVGSGQLAISVANGVWHDVWISGNNSARVTHEASNQDFLAEVKFNSIPTERYQLQGILIEQDANNFLRFDFYSNGGNLNIFSAVFQAGQPTVKVNTSIAEDGPLYLRVKREGNQWTQQYSYDGNNWQTAVSFSHALTVTSTSLFAGNAGTNTPAFTALVDYYRTNAE